MNALDIEKAFEYQGVLVKLKSTGIKDVGFLPHTKEGSCGY